MSPPPPAPTISLHAYAIAGTLPPRVALTCFDGAVTLVRSTKTLALARRAEGQWIVAFDFGAVVFVDVPAEERERVVKAVLAKVGAENRPPTIESLAIEVAPGERPSARFDRVVVPAVDQGTVEVLALIVGQSAAMEYFEDDVDVVLGELDRHAAALASTGRFRGSERALLRFVGRGMEVRNHVVHTLALLDAPLLVWESELLDRLYRELRAMFEIEDRYRALDHKLNMLRDGLGLLVEVTRHRRSTVIEVAVLVLVAVEVVLFVYQLAFTSGH